MFIPRMADQKYGMQKYIEKASKTAADNQKFATRHSLVVYSNIMPTQRLNLGINLGIVLQGNAHSGSVRPQDIRRHPAPPPFINQFALSK